MRRDTRVAAAVLPLVPLVILAATIGATWLVAHGAGEAWRLPFRLLCHGIPERCLIAFGTRMPICARCFGIYVGLFAGLVAFRLVPRARPTPLGWAAVVAAVPMAVDGITQALTLRTSNNPLRLATGFTAAFVFGLWVLSSIESVRELPDQAS